MADHTLAVEVRELRTAVAEEVCKHAEEQSPRRLERIE